MRCSGAVAERSRQRPPGDPVKSLILRTFLAPFMRLGWRVPTLLVTLFGLLAGCAGFDAQQRKWIFQAATVPVSVDPAAASEPTVADMDDVWIEHASPLSGRPIRLHALWHAHPDDDAPVLLYLHGARRDVEGSVFRIRQMSALGFSVLAVDYRGFGRSTDELPSEATVYEDARAAWRWLGERAAGRDRYMFGHSLGGAIAIQLGSEVNDAKGLIVEGTFTSLRDVFDSMRFGWLPLGPLITQRFDSARKIEKVQAPVLVVHGLRDTLIPPALGRSLYERARGPKRLVLVEGGSHYSTNAVGAAQYRHALHELFGLGSPPEPLVSVN